MAQKVSVCSERQQGVTIKSYVMPKVKTNSSAKKRFKVTGGGKISFQKAFKRCCGRCQFAFCKTFTLYEVSPRKTQSLTLKKLKYATFSKCRSQQGPP